MTPAFALGVIGLLVLSSFFDRYEVPVLASYQSSTCTDGQVR
jgi:hypothetical protein